MSLQTTGSFGGLPGSQTIYWALTQVSLNPIQKSGSFSYMPYASSALAQANQAGNALGSAVSFPITSTQYNTYFTDAAIVTGTGLTKQCDAMAIAVAASDSGSKLFGATEIA